MKSILTIIILLQATILFSQTKNIKDDGRKIRLPVVFHVIYNNDNENVNDSLILNELRDLKLDFNKQNEMSLLDSDFQNIVGNPNIEFHLLDTIFQKNKSKGIRRISKTDFHKKTDLLINSKECLNIFIANQENSSNILSDRVNLNYKSIGLNSHVLTHETGHWMGLYHIFGQIGNSKWYRVMFGNKDDLIDDTPVQKGATAVCYKITKKCPCPPKKTKYKKHKILYNNFMDYNPCRCMFTIGQSIKMRNNIIEHKRIVFDKSK
jgi:hypothetical protein